MHKFINTGLRVFTLLVIINSFDIKQQSMKKRIYIVILLIISSLSNVIAQTEAEKARMREDKRLLDATKKAYSVPENKTSGSSSSTTSTKSNTTTSNTNSGGYVSPGKNEVGESVLNEVFSGLAKKAKEDEEWKAKLSADRANAKEEYLRKKTIALDWSKHSKTGLDELAKEMIAKGIENEWAYRYDIIKMAENIKRPFSNIEYLDYFDIKNMFFRPEVHGYSFSSGIIYYEVIYEAFQRVMSLEDKFKKLARLMYAGEITNEHANAIKIKYFAEAAGLTAAECTQYFNTTGKKKEPFTSIEKIYNETGPIWQAERQALATKYKSQLEEMAKYIKNRGETNKRKYQIGIGKVAWYVFKDDKIIRKLFPYPIDLDSRVPKEDRGKPYPILVNFLK